MKAISRGRVKQRQICMPGQSEVKGPRRLSQSQDCNWHVSVYSLVRHDESAWNGLWDQRSVHIEGAVAGRDQN